MLEKNFYKDALIAMSFFAVLFFIILVAILILWCIKRRQTEVKTVVIQPKKRPVKTVTHSNGGGAPANNVDVEGGAITADEIELSDDQEEGFTKLELTTEDSTEPNDSKQGEVNPTFQKDDDEGNAEVTADDS